MISINNYTFQFQTWKIMYRNSQMKIKIFLKHNSFLNAYEVTKKKSVQKYSKLKRERERKETSIFDHLSSKFQWKQTHGICRASTRPSSRNPGYSAHSHGRRGTCPHPRYSARTWGRWWWCCCRGLSAGHPFMNLKQFIELVPPIIYTRQKK